MQDDVAELLRSATRDHANTKVRAPPRRLGPPLYFRGSVAFHSRARVSQLRLKEGAHVCFSSAACVCGRAGVPPLASVSLQPLCFLCAGQPRANPVRAELHRGGAPPADGAGGLPQSAHGESRHAPSEPFLPLGSAQPAVLVASQDYVQALTGLCYDGVEGLIYLVLFSFVTALMFSSIVCSVPHTWPGKR